MPIPAEELAAHHNAAIVVAAYHYDVTVVSASIKLHRGRRGHPVLMSQADYFASRVPGRSSREAASDYVTTLLAGTVGRVLALEFYLGLEELHPELLRLRRGYLAEAFECREPETDAAFAMILAMLGGLDGGDVPRTFTRLWCRAETLLRADLHRSRMGLIVHALKREQALDGHELLELLCQSH
jgi:hypothetical protein